MKNKFGADIIFGKIEVRHTTGIDLINLNQIKLPLVPEFIPLEQDILPLSVYMKYHYMNHLICAKVSPL